MNRLLILFFVASATSTINAQKTGYDEDGKKVLLNDDGTWEYVSTETKSVQHVYYGNERYPASESVKLTSSISARIVDKNGRAMIVFIEKCNETVRFFDLHWSGNVYLYLNNDERILLLDRNITGIEESDGDIFRYSGHYLSGPECDKLRRYNIIRLQYTVEDNPQSKTFSKRVTIGSTAIKESLWALGF